MARLDKNSGMWPLRDDPARRGLVADARLGEEPQLNEYSSVGALMRVTREQVGLDLPEVARQLRIRHSYLEAIEAGNFSALPGMTYAIGYVRTYAHFLDLDPQFAVKRFKAEAEGLERRHELAFPSPPPEGRVPGGAILFVSLILAAIGYSGWYYLSASDRTLADVVPEIPIRFSSLIGGDEGTSTALNDVAGRPSEPITVTQEKGAAVTRTPQSSSEPVVKTETVTAELAKPTPSPTVVVATGSGQHRIVKPETVKLALGAASEQTNLANPKTVDDSDAASIQPPNAPAQPAHATNDEDSAEAATPATETREQAETTVTESTVSEPATPVVIPAAPQVASSSLIAAHAEAPTDNSAAAVAAVASANGTIKGRIVIRATSDSWVQVRAGETGTLMTRVMRSGDTYVVPDRDGLRLFTGNAGALEVLVDGEVTPRLGPVGKIARNVRLEPGLLKEGRATERN